MLVSNNLVNSNIIPQNPYKGKFSPRLPQNQVSFGNTSLGTRKLSSVLLFLSMLANGGAANAASNDNSPQVIMPRDGHISINVEIPNTYTTKAERRNYAIKTNLETLASKLHLFPSDKLPPKLQSGWVENVRVLASNAQSETGVITVKYSYLRSLITTLVNNRRVRTIEEANDYLAHKGYKSVDEGAVKPQDQQKSLVQEARMQSSEEKVIDDFSKKEKIPNEDKKYLTTYHSFKSKGRALGIFNKNEKNKNRFVLALTCEEDPDNSGSYLYKKISNSFVAEVKKIYNIPDENILTVTTTSGDDFNNGISSIVRKIKNLENRDNVEFLLFYVGDGISVEPWKGAKYRQGAMDGAISMSNIKNTSLSEDEIRTTFNKMLKGIKFLFVINACNSASFIAKTAPSKTKNAARKLSHLR